VAARRTLGGVTDQTRPDRPRRPAETWLFETLRLGVVGGAAALFAILYALFVAAALAVGDPPIMSPGSPYLLSVPAWAALILSLILSVGTATLYYGRRAPRDERAGLAEAFGGDDADALALMVANAGTTHWTEIAAFWAGTLPGLWLAWLMLDIGELRPADLLAPSRVWYLVAVPTSIGLLCRAFANSIRSDQVLSQAVREGYRHDPLRPERSFVFGRLALRGALTWFLIAAVIMLFFVRGAGSVGAAATIGVAIAGALSSLIAPLTSVRRRIRIAKEAELARLRDAMAEARETALAGDAGGAQRLGGLAAYEQSVRTSPDWPLSAPVTTRFLLYVLALVRLRRRRADRVRSRPLGAAGRGD